MGARLSKAKTVDSTAIVPWPDSIELQFTPSPELQGDGDDARAARKTVGEEIQQMVLADETGKGALMSFYNEIDIRWLGRDANVIQAPWDGAPQFNLQTMRNKTDQATAFTVLPHVKAWPYFLYREGGPEGSNNNSVEQAVSYFLHRAKYGLKLAQSTGFVFRRGSCPMKVEYIKSRPGRKASIKLTPIDLQYFRMYPNSAECFDEAVLVGDVIQVTVDYVERRQRDGRYFADEKIAAGQTRLNVNADPSGDKQMSTSNAAFAKDDKVDLFVGMMARDWDGSGEYQWKRVEHAIDHAVLLYEEPFDSYAFPYADLFVHKELGRNYNESCMCGLLIDPHDWTNYISDSMGWLQTYATMPPYAGAGIGLEDEVVVAKPGELLGMEEGAQIFKMGGDVNLGSFPQQLAMSRQVADETSRVTQNGLGSNIKADTSATEVSQMAAGQATGIEAYQFLGLCYGLSEVGYAVQWLLAENFDDWYQDYREVVPMLTRKDFEREYYVEINGQTPINTPAAIAAQVTQLMQAWAGAVQVQPDLPQRLPDFVMNILRALTESMTLPNRSKIMPTREEQERKDQEIKQQQDETRAALAKLADGIGGSADPGVGDGTSGIQGSPDGVPGINSVIAGGSPTPQESSS